MSWAAARGLDTDLHSTESTRIHPRICYEVNVVHWELAECKKMSNRGKGFGGH
jgi:hypothetical protein